MSVPPVTVVIPAWDEYADHELREAAASVRAQPVAAELVVVDNASRRPLTPLPGARVVRVDERVTTGSARNAGLAVVRSAFVIFLDADDRLLPGALGEMVRGLEAEPELSSLGFGVVQLGSGRRYRAPRRFVGLLVRRRRLFALASTVWSLLPTQGATIHRTAAVREAGGYGDAEYGEDWSLMTALAVRGRVGVRFTPALALRERGGTAPWQRTGEQLAIGRRAFLRAARDPATPRWLRVALPFSALTRAVLLLVARPPVRAGRWLWGVLARGPRRVPLRRPVRPM
jgi:glycosyltransferase involved in cell wall biosynthesis